MVHAMKEVDGLYFGKTCQMEALIEKKEIRLKFCNLRYKVTGEKKHEGKYILKHVCGEFKSGHLSAIIGPSGAGKTTLLNLLSGFKGNGIDGDILVNDEKQNIPEFRKMSSYIPQEFAILENITAKENLKYAADFKLGSAKIVNEEKLQKITRILKLLNLEKCKDTMVSQLSGGERKRLSIAVELITNPPVMFFDEPTSGLDSVASMQVLSHLKELATDGRAIICVIHQPSSKILKLIDDILVLSDGGSFYCGPLEKMLDEFKTAGFDCPSYYNPADFALEVANKELPGDLKALLSSNSEKFNSLKEIVISPGAIQETADSAVPFRKKKILFLEKLKCKFGLNERKYPVNFVEQFTILLKRSTLVNFRELSALKLRLFMHVLTGFVVGAVFYNIGGDAATILPNASFLFFSLLFLFFGNAMPTILTCPLETNVFLREYLNGWYTIKAYFLSKFVADLPMIFTCSTMYGSIAYYLTGQPYDMKIFFMFWVQCILITIQGQSLGLFCGSSFDIRISIFMIPAICMPTLLFSGFFIRYNDLAEYLKPLMSISFFRYSLEGLIQSVYDYDRTDLQCSRIYCYYRNAAQFLKDFSIQKDTYNFDTLVTILVIIIFQLCFLISLYVRVRKAQ